MTHTLAAYLDNNSSIKKIVAIGQFIKHHVDHNWKVVLAEKQEQLEHAFATVGEPSYGTYLHFLYNTLNNQLQEAGFRASTRFPGDMDISREWGTNPEETDQYRCMWTTLYAINSDTPVGTIVTVLPHDHTEFRIPSKPPVFALEETTKADIVAALSKRYAEHDFANLLEFHVYIAQLRANQQNKN